MLNVMIFVFTKETVVKPKRTKSVRRKANAPDEDRYALPPNVLRGVNDFLMQKSENVNMAPLVEVNSRPDKEFIVFLAQLV